MNALQGGLAFSDVAVTVSPTHAQELCTPEGGFGLQETFTAMGDRLTGILNGIDPVLWDPATDPEITENFSGDDVAGKRRCKAALQRAYGLAQRAHTPLFGMSARMVTQKGLDLVLGADLLATSDAQFIFLAAVAQAIRRAVERYADRTAWRKLVREAMARRFGWDRSAERYLALYRRALALP